MRFTESKDGISRITVLVSVRVSHDEVLRIKNYLREKGAPFTDHAVKEFIRESTETHYPSNFYETEVERFS